MLQRRLFSCYQLSYLWGQRFLRLTVLKLAYLFCWGSTYHQSSKKHVDFLTLVHFIQCFRSYLSLFGYLEDGLSYCSEWYVPLIHKYLLPHFRWNLELESLSSRRSSVFVEIKRNRNFSLNMPPNTVMMGCDWSSAKEMILVRKGLILRCEGKQSAIQSSMLHTLMDSQMNMMGYRQQFDCIREY